MAKGSSQRSRQFSVIEIDLHDRADGKEDAGDQRRDE
jgi:hypothetical protein